MNNKGFWDRENNSNNDETALTTPAPEAFYNEISPEDKDKKENDDKYYEVINDDNPKYIIWSLISIILGGISVLCALFGWGGIFVGISAIAFAIVSRISLKFFDKISIMGLILGIFGTVFGIAVIVFGILVENGALTDYYVQKK